ncbi:Uu.00g117440.m01.CDS01 [Anthostomella pinea]|uniref:Uu.00g117440.m01.CDS01 n=1 Tax=Anthostomella pinea TaxID=933095 RepID=A0AAI8YGU6_9PEZI|nr:Uu.00g117440.m01.CDS01 [Anthostomella pinea]
MDFYMRPEFEADKSAGKGRKMTTDNPLLPGCRSRKELLASQQQLKDGILTEQAYRKLIQAAVKDHKLRDSRSPWKILRLHLRSTPLDGFSNLP